MLFNLGFLLLCAILVGFGASGCAPSCRCIQEFCLVSTKKPVRRKPLVDVQPLNWVAPEQRKDDIEDDKSFEQQDTELTAQV